MNVLIITGIFPPDIGGPASYVPAIASSLVQRGHKVTVITLSDATIHSDAVYPFTVIRILRSMARLLRVLKTIERISSHGKKADILFVHGLALEAVIANLRAAQTARAKNSRGSCLGTGMHTGDCSRRH